MERTHSAVSVILNCILDIMLRYVVADSGIHMQPLLMAGMNLHSVLADCMFLSVQILT